MTKKIQICAIIKRARNFLLSPPQKKNCARIFGFTNVLYDVSFESNLEELSLFSSLTVLVSVIVCSNTYAKACLLCFLRHRYLEISHRSIKKAVAELSMKPRYLFVRSLFV